MSIHINKESLLYNVLPFGIIWLVFAMVYIVLEKSILGDLNYYPSTNIPYSFSLNFKIIAPMAFIVGMLMGIFEKRFFQRIFAGRKFRIKVLIKSLFYMAVTVVFLSIISAITSSWGFEIKFFSQEAWGNVENLLNSFAFFGLVLYIAVMVVVSLFYMEISQSVNKNTLNNFLIGTYNQPITEEGIFMFVDMKSSTSHAEGLGHTLYFKLLQEYYKDLSLPIEQFKGDIYQYAGDQVIVTWTIDRGLKKHRVVKCLLSMRKILDSHRDRYLKKYGVFPEFKVGIHTGPVTTGEIGEVKKEILFTGDVLNSTARIQDLCNFYGVDNLISKELLDKLSTIDSKYFKRIGEVKLKGKKKPTELFTIL